MLADVRLGLEELFWQVDGKVVGIEEKDIFEGRKQHRECFELIFRDLKREEGLLNYMRQDDAFRVQCWQDFFADLAFVLFRCRKEYLHWQCRACPP